MTTLLLNMLPYIVAQYVPTLDNNNTKGIEYVINKLNKVIRLNDSMN